MYETLEYLYKIKSFEDLALLKQESFSKICRIDDLSINLNQSNSFLSSQNKENGFLSSENQLSYPFHLSQSLQYQSRSYGELVFYSHKRFSQAKKSLLGKLSLSLSAKLFFIEKKEKAIFIKNQWREIFNSFPQAFCVTNNQFQIIRCNPAFKKLFRKNKQNIFSQNLFKLFPVPVKIPKSFIKKPSSFIAKGENHKIYWEITCKKLYLRGEANKSFLFLIKDISSEMEFEAKISSQSKNQEIGWMKGSLAHELNNPITGIKLLISIIKNELADSEKDIQENLKEMEKSISTCQNVIQNLLSASKKPTTDSC